MTKELNDVLDCRAFHCNDKQAQLAAYDDAQQRREQMFKERKQQCD